VARRVLDQPLRRVGVGGAVALLAVTAAFGGLREQTQDGPEVLALDAPVEVAPFEIAVHRIVWTTDLPGQHLSAEGNRWVGVVATVRNTSDAGVLGTTLQEALTLSDVDGLVAGPGEHGVAPTSVALLDDASGLSPVQPGLTYEAAFLFEQEGTATPPTSAIVQLQQHTWRRGSLDPSFTWTDPATTLRGELPVRAAVSDEEGDA
jgi:hypothetical protein